MDDALVEFEKVKAMPNDAAVSERTRVEVLSLGSVPKEEVPLENWSSSNLAAFNNWLGMLIVCFNTMILAFLNRMKARKEVRGQDGRKRG